MRRLQFVLNTLAACLLGLFDTAESPAKAERPQSTTWAERIAEDASMRRGRRYEHWIQARLCHGEYDNCQSPELVAKRQERCAKICGLCRYINSLTVWPVPNYRRPPQDVLDALELQAWCSTWRTEAPYSSSSSG